ncbi:MAG: TetR family transcriptional regulator C-terminal domain-containing protein [Proteobacteria bacterium]|nr:TetR family transcriptional regulator C-terminal domain-containing protein [Pseudomonadota bacterium]
MPKIVDHAERRAEFAEAAFKTIVENGIENASVRAVASAAGSSTGALVHYFGSKDDLLLHALRHAGSKVATRMLAALDRHNGVEGLRQVLFEALPLDEERAGEWRIWLAFWGRAVNDPELFQEQQTRYRRWRDLVQSVIEGCQREGALPASLDAVHEAQLILAFIDGLGVQATFDPEQMPPARQREALTTTLERLQRQPH